MKACAYCGRENADDVPHCRECGSADFVAAPPAPASAAPVQKTEAVEVPDPEPDAAPDGESALCLVCLFPNVPDVNWCKRCGAPMGPTTSIVPTDAALSMGYVYRGAVQNRPKPVLLIGVWVLFLPGLMGNGFVLWYVFRGEIVGIKGVAALWLALAGGALCAVMLYRVSKKYFGGVRDKREEQSD